jgi:mono/diheme cytochrome c family protein
MTNGLISLAAPALLISLVSGCTRPLEFAYSPRGELQELTKKHQDQIAEALSVYFGTPRFPKFMQSAPEDQQPPAAESPLLIDKLDRMHLGHGRDVYIRQCSGCHGPTGDGQGPAAPFLDPPPRDYRLGQFKFTSTPRGVKPRRADLERIIRYGAKGTSMPSFRWMADEDVDAVIDYVILLSSRGELEFRLMKFAQQELAEEDDIVPPAVADEAQFIAHAWANADIQIVRPRTAQTPYTKESAEAGAKAFISLNCYKCHGRDGRGNKAQDVGKDDWGRIAHAADLTSGMLHGGRRPIDIYRRMYSGINGTPMPAFSQPDTGKGETENQRSETIWHLVHFITNVVEGKSLPKEILDAELAEQLKNQSASAPPTPAASGDR